MGKIVPRRPISVYNRCIAVPDNCIPPFGDIMSDENPTPQDMGLSLNGDSISAVIKASEYLLLPRPNLEFIWDNRVPKPGVTLMSGEPKLGKSHLALQLALAIAEGRPFGGQPTKQSKVLYLMLEAELSWKLLLKKASPLPDNLVIPHPDFPTKPPYTNIMERATVQWIRAMVDECDPTIIFLDPLRDSHSVDEQSSTEMKRAADMLKMLFVNRAQVSIHHTNKMSGDFEDPNPIRAARGSSGLTGTVDTIWTFYGKDRNIKTLSMLPKWEDEEYLSLERQGNGFWKFVGDPVPAKEHPPSKVTSHEVPSSNI